MSISSPQSSTRPQFRTTGEVRAVVAKHLEKGLPVEALGIEPNRPLNKSDFAFVGITPSVKRHDDYYRCSFCQVNKKFSKGRVVLSSDGLLRLIGPECWDINLDADTLIEARQDWDDYTKHERFLRLKDRMQPLLTEAITSFSMLQRDHSDLISFIDNFPCRLAKEAPQLFSLLEKAHRMNGQLQVERTVRDYSRDGRNGEAFYTFQLNTLHVVPGLKYVVDGFLPPYGDKTPAHLDQFAPFGAKPNSVNDGSRRDVVARLNIARRAEHIQEAVNLFPGVMLGEASAHRLSRYMTWR